MRYIVSIYVKLFFDSPLAVLTHGYRDIKFTQQVFTALRKFPPITRIIKNAFSRTKVQIHSPGIQEECVPKHPEEIRFKLFNLRHDKVSTIRSEEHTSELQSQ